MGKSRNEQAENTAQRKRKSSPESVLESEDDCGDRRQTKKQSGNKDVEALRRKFNRSSQDSSQDSAGSGSVASSVLESSQSSSESSTEGNVGKDEGTELMQLCVPQDSNKDSIQLDSPVFDVNKFLDDTFPSSMELNDEDGPGVLLGINLSTFGDSLATSSHTNASDSTRSCSCDCSVQVAELRQEVRQVRILLENDIAGRTRGDLKAESTSKATAAANNIDTKAANAFIMNAMFQDSGFYSDVTILPLLQEFLRNGKAISAKALLKTISNVRANLACRIKKIVVQILTLTLPDSNDPIACVAFVKKYGEVVSSINSNPKNVRRLPSWDLVCQANMAYMKQAAPDAEVGKIQESRVEALTIMCLTALLTVSALPKLKDGLPMFIKVFQGLQ